MLHNARNSSALVPLLVVVVLLPWLAACIHYPRFTFGEIPADHSCIALFPFANINDPTASDNLVGDYLALSLVNAGARATLAPRDVLLFFKQAKLELPEIMSMEDAFYYGGLFHADSVIFGHVAKLALADDVNNPKNPAMLMGVDLYLLNVKENNVTWVYSSRFYTSKESYVTDLSKFSKDISKTLLANYVGKGSASGKSCWDEAEIVANLRAVDKWQPSSQAEAASASSKVAPQPQVQLSKGAERIYQSLLAKKVVKLGGLFKGRSSRLLEARKMQLRIIGEAMAALPASSQFMIEGHIDATDDSNNDFWISAQQINKVRELLHSDFNSLKGRLQIRTKAGTNPLVPNINQKSREKNRRILISVVSP